MQCSAVQTPAAAVEQDSGAAAAQQRIKRLETLVELKKLYRNCLRAETLLAQPSPVYSPSASESCGDMTCTTQMRQPSSLYKIRCVLAQPSIWWQSESPLPPPRMPHSYHQLLLCHSDADPAHAAAQLEAIDSMVSVLGSMSEELAVDAEEQERIDWATRMVAEMQLAAEQLKVCPYVT